MFSLSYAKIVIRAANLEEWKKRYAEGIQYRFRFKLKNSPYCDCKPAKIQDVLHIFEDCDTFIRERAALEAEIDVRVARRHFREIMKNAT
ncbi:hypothetical protein EVAR_11594_1 [Eumeta japonica]|uniref:Uncharacterized protein n=1 Tax=Eumeta variegata TaxID=151549 RepID=A0A4C1X7J6_EUMVA|nr:hypothetical protein EVAR_11594_1 [Eumeta japonica]